MTADLIERYVDRLPTELRGSAHEIRRILSEAEEHLGDATSELTAAGHHLHLAAVRRVPGVLPGRGKLFAGCRAAPLGEVVEYRVAAGVLGLLVLGTFTLWRRGCRRQDAQYLGVLPDGFSATVATSLYGLAAAILGLQTLESFVSGNQPEDRGW